MAEFQAMRDMDEFLINPTIKTDHDQEFSRQPSLSDDLIPMRTSDAGLTTKSSAKAPERTGTIRKFANAPFLSRGYTSEEEAASPTSNDDSGFGFSSSDTESSSPSLRDSSSFEDFAETGHAIQLCRQAQTVQLVSVGRPKVVSVSKLDITSALRRERPATSSASQTPASETASINFSRPVHIYRQARGVQSGPSSDNSPTVPPPGFAFTDRAPEQSVMSHTVRRKPNLTPFPAVQPSRVPRSGLPKAEKPLSAQRLSAQRADFVRPEPFPTNWPLPSSAPQTPTKSIAQKLSSQFSLRVKGRSRRQDSRSSESSADDEVVWVRMPASATQSTGFPDMQTPSRPKPKMIPRGASERAAPIKLPPCPDGYHTDDEHISYSPQWPLRKVSVPAHSSFGSAVETPTKHARRKSVSAALATAQA